MHLVQLTSTALPALSVLPAVHTATLPAPVTAARPGVVLNLTQDAVNSPATVRYQLHQPALANTHALLNAGKIAGRRAAIERRSTAMEKEVRMFMEVEQHLARAQTLLGASRTEHASRKLQLDQLLVPPTAAGVQ